ncbi:methyltransferase domain-containing protein [Streptomyces sp. NPDC020379]|uniref:methyltransferase domain-containing protein n=1 Tax=Streptomyces sp. NPDC020379 TaxID=3365071 RepID=UPI0037B9BD31
MWASLAYDVHQPLTTQVDDGHPGPEGGTLPTSSISAMDSVFTMLAAADLAPEAATSDRKILDIGTGTGYNAALLCEHVGDHNVVTLDIDKDLTESARERLATAGYHPTVVAVNGENGWPEGTPYDRTLCTASLQQVPFAWLERVRGVSPRFGSRSPPPTPVSDCNSCPHDQIIYLGVHVHGSDRTWRPPMPSLPWLARTSSVIGSVGLAVVLATAASAAPLATCSLQVDDGTTVSSREVSVGQCVNPSLTTHIQSVAVGSRAGSGSMTVFQFRNCTGNVVRQGPSPMFFNPSVTIGSVRIDSCP